MALDDNRANIAVDFIKIDIQGYEYFAFQGMHKLLASNPHLILVSEFWP